MKQALKNLVGKFVATGIRYYLRYPMERETAPIDLTVAAQFLATASSAQYLLKNMLVAKNCHTQKGLLEFALESCSIEGLVLEFGVYRGETIRVIAKQSKHAYGFDSFEGVAAPWRFDIDMKFFDVGGKFPKVPANVTLVKGYFDQTLPSFMTERQGQPVRLVHIDSDIYSSAKTIFENLKGAIVPGTVIVFDEYWNYCGWEEHEHLAFMEFIEETGLRYEYIGFASGHLSVAVKIV